jgi:hypothetical protein
MGGATTANLWQTDGYSGLGTGLSSWPITGYHGGVEAEIDLNSLGLMIETSLSYYQYGSHLANSLGFLPGPNNSTIDYSETNLKINTLRLPINLMYKYSITDKWKVFAGFGPYIAKTLSGTEKGYYKGFIQNPDGSYNVIYGGIDNKAQISSGFSYAPGGTTKLASFDIGANVLFGVQYKKFKFAFNYNRGFTQVYRNKYANTGNFAWSYTVSYMIFGHDKKAPL